jgi:predicted transposase YbfD/YdcC
MISAWAAERGVLLGEVATDAKSNEITAIPALLETLDIRDTTVTVDADGTQKKIAAEIVGQGAGYLLALKANHPRCTKRWPSTSSTSTPWGECSMIVASAARHRRARTRLFCGACLRTDARTRRSVSSRLASAAWGSTSSSSPTEQREQPLARRVSEHEVGHRDLERRGDLGERVDGGNDQPALELRPRAGSPRNRERPS